MYDIDVPGLVGPPIWSEEHTFTPGWEFSVIDVPGVDTDALFIRHQLGDDIRSGIEQGYHVYAVDGGVFDAWTTVRVVALTAQGAAARVEMPSAHPEIIWTALSGEPLYGVADPHSALQYRCAGATCVYEASGWAYSIASVGDVDGDGLADGVIGRDGELWLY